MGESKITVPDPCGNLSHRWVYIEKALKPNKNLDSMARMNTKLIGLSLAVSLVAGAACFAANPQMGTWKVNEAKSKLAPGMGENTTVTYKNMLGNTKVT